MSSRRGVKQVRNQLFNGALFLLLSLNSISADGNVGCLYSDQVCDLATEWCYDDRAFGRCVFKTGFAQDDLFRYDFHYNDLEKLKQELEELKKLGFTWKHAYTQCIVQTQLYTIRTGVPYNGEICEQILKSETPRDPIRELQYERMRLPQANTRNSPVNGRSISEGIVRYVPDDGGEKPELEHNSYKQATDYENELLNQLGVQSGRKPEMYKKSKNFKSTLPRHRGTPLYLPIHNRIPSDYENEGEEENENKNENSKQQKMEFEHGKEFYLMDPKKTADDFVAFEDTFKMLKQMGNKAYAEGGPVDISDKKDDYENSVYDKILDQYRGDIFGFQRSERLDVKKPGPFYKVNNYAFGNVNTVPENNGKISDEEIKSEKKVARNVNIGRSLPFIEQKSEYEYVPNYGHLSYVIIETNNNLTRPSAHSFIGTLRNMYNLPPGVFKEPIIFGNVLVLTVARNIVNYSATDIKRRIEEYYNSMNKIAGIDIKKIYVSFSDEPIKDMAESDQYNTESHYAYIQLKDKPNNRIKTWTYADDIIESIGAILNLPKGAFRDIKTAEPAGILFRIGPHVRNLTTKEVAEKINQKKEEISKRLKIDIQSAGVYNKNSLPTAVRVEPDDSQMSIPLIVCLLVVSVSITLGGLYYVARDPKKKDKFYGFSREKEIIKDQMDSFRSKSSGKSNQDNAVTGQRITSLSRESDNSPSSRSSTSSWIEEPMTNMDITTGHMVLAYMEDHLTNKARLDTEWAALCAYDADPCSVAIAQQQENIRKNRYVNALPYDHARVILNALSNINGSDYINASTITDHDPRNAAYIATQGPLENTICDFWQMIWEQGCVVIVMLTRLVENDTSMCHRYWPLEGAELYNIYEVHLVSEHIWCDDFLVRSFYLKNLKTTETRTVTQFHFLTWPEGGIPSATKPLLEFRRKVNKSFRGRSCPIVVHCSDGVGRTGSYLLLDMVLNRISKGAKEIDIAATLEHIRDQRAGAVCTKQQFQFVLSAVAEEVQAVLKALPQQQQASQDQNAENVAPLVQVSNDPSEAVATTSAVDINKIDSVSVNVTNEMPRKPSK